MAKRFLTTTIPTVDEEKVEQFEAQLGRKPKDSEIEYSYAEVYIDLLMVSAIRQSYDEHKLMEDECVIYMGSDTFYARTPYAQAVAQWLEVIAPEEKETSRASVDVGTAVKILAEELGKDKSEGSLYYGYQSNIAMAYKEAYRQAFNQAKGIDLHVVANDAAKNFLDHLIKSVK
jgi:hypothetical protein